jgi:hypothetical protein
MAMPSTWAPAAPGARYGLDRGRTAPVTELTAVPNPSQGAADEANPWHPDNPLFAFAAIAALTFGLMAFSTTVRVGSTHASVSLGNSK